MNQARTKRLTRDELNDKNSLDKCIVPEGCDTRMRKNRLEKIAEVA